MIYWIYQKAIESISVISVHWFIEGALNESFGQPFFWANIKIFLKQKGVSFSLIVVLNISFGTTTKKNNLCERQLILNIALNKNSTKSLCERIALNTKLNKKTTCVNIFHITKNNLCEQLFEEKKESFPLLLDHYPYHNFLTWTLFSYFWQRILNERNSFVQN